MRGSSPTDPAPGTGLVELGRVLHPHRTDGRLVVALHSDEPETALQASELVLCGESGTIPFQVQAVAELGRGRDGGVRLELRLGEIEKRTLERGQEWLGREIGRRGLGRLQIYSPEGRGWANAIGWASHHMGTTRMHGNPRRGVVDPDCRVHGVSNLYVAGSSIFPTGGTANPTLTIVALALRLAELLRREAK